MEAMTPEWQEIMRLWGVIQRLTQRKEAKMTDKEEAVFGLVYQEFKRGTSKPHNVSGEDPAIVKIQLIQNAAFCLRALYDLCEAK